MALDKGFTRRDSDMIVAVLQSYAPPTIRLTRLEEIREPRDFTTRLYVYFTRAGKTEEERFSVPITDHARKSLTSWFPHEQILTKLRLLG